MVLKKSKTKELKVGDLVTHILYGKEWVGIILGFKERENISDSTREMALVQIQPGTKYEGFFEKNVSKQNKKTSNSGFVSANWLFKLKER